MNRKVLFPVLVLMAVVAALVAGCASTQTETPSQTTGPQQKTLIVGIDGEYPPYSYVNPDGSVAGFDVDSMRWIAEKKGLKVTFQPTAWDGIIPSLIAGKIDLIYSGMTITEERAQQVNFSIPYWQVNQSVSIHDDTDFTMDDFLGGTLKVGAQRGTTGAMWVEENLIEKGLMAENRLVLYDSFPLAATDLQNKRVDAIIYDTPPMLDAIAGKPLHIIGEIDTGELYGVAVRKTDPELLATINEGLTELMADPYWEDLKQKYEMD
ncbi:MAG: transporter substrate-binding domain-containing protein [Methanomicrobiales archaeon]|nr:transporter substrate-binding domain-containing protein [Methanomicrobiales archaeon]